MTSVQVKNRTTIDTALLNLSCSPLLEQLYANRGITEQAKLDNSTKTLLHAKQLKGINEACELLYSALLASQKIIVVGDFDADGATSTALSILALRALGFTNIDHAVQGPLGHVSDHVVNPESVGSQ